MKNVRFCLLLLILTVFGQITVMAQDDDGMEATLSADVVSQYVWRGQDLGGVSLQPTLGISYKGLSLTAWGSVGISEPDDTKEFDLTLGYAIGGLNLAVTDYWFNEGLDPRNRYFKYDAHATNHLFEANVGYDFGVASLQWYTNFAGNDGCNKDGKRAYSSYFELAVPFRLATADWTATAGAVPFATDFYDTNGFSVINLALRAEKEIKVSESFSIPLFAEIAANPRTQKAFFTYGLTLQPFQ